MKVTKLGHCCMVIEEDGLRILTDPGLWTSAQNDVKEIDVILITHEHPDHLHLDSLKAVLANNPGAKVVTNTAVGKIIGAENIQFQTLEHGQNLKIGSVLLEGYGHKHAVIFNDYGQVQNTGFFIANKLFYPGDSLYNPGKPVDILALPVAGPWVKISESVNYALVVKPRICFPVHDGMLKIFTGFHMVPEKILTQNGIQFQIPELEKEIAL